MGHAFGETQVCSANLLCGSSQVSLVYQSPHWLQETMALSCLHTTDVFSHEQVPFLQRTQTPNTSTHSISELKFCI